MKAAIDIGSNSVRLAVQNGMTRSHITKLADSLNSTGVLSPDGVEKTIAAIEEYVKVCRECGCDEIIIFATEAVRAASDGETFCEKVYAGTGIEVKIVPPEGEAELALAGVKKPDGPITVCDLGGGSMEIISSTDGKKPCYAKSLPYGVVVMKNRFGADYRKAINEMPALLEEYGKVPGYPVVFCGGSACTIAAAILDLKTYDKDKVSAKFTAKQLDGAMPMLLCKKLSVMRPLTKPRADTVPIGAVIIQATLNYLGATEFYVSDASNLEAVLNGFKL